MKKLIVILIAVIIGLLSFGCNKKNTTFYLDEQYYGNSIFEGINKDTFDNLINNKNSFAIFIHQPYCSVSYEFNDVLIDFANQYQISFYKMSYSEMKKTKLVEHIKYYPSLVIYHDGKMVDYLDATSNEHNKYYKNVNEFKKWFSNYVIIK